MSPLDVSWDLLLKAYSFPYYFQNPKYHKALREALLQMDWSPDYTHVDERSTDREHYDKRHSERFAQDQKMPRGFEQETPERLALAMAHITLENHPELMEALSTEQRDGQTPSMIMEALHTDEPQIYHDDSGQKHEAHTYAPVLWRNEKTGKIGVKSVVGSINAHTGKGKKTRRTIKVYPENHRWAQALENRAIHHELPGLFDMGNHFPELEEEPEPEFEEEVEPEPKSKGALTRERMKQTLADLDAGVVHASPGIMSELTPAAKRRWVASQLPLPGAQEVPTSHERRQAAKEREQQLGAERRQGAEESFADWMGERQAETRRAVQRRLEAERQEKLMESQLTNQLDPAAQALMEQLTATGAIGQPKQSQPEPTSTMCMGCGASVNITEANCPSCGYRMKSEPMDLAFRLLKTNSMTNLPDDFKSRVSWLQPAPELPQTYQSTLGDFDDNWGVGNWPKASQGDSGLNLMAQQDAAKVGEKYRNDYTFDAGKSESRRPYGWLATSPGPQLNPADIFATRTRSPDHTNLDYFTAYHPEHGRLGTASIFNPGGNTIDPLSQQHKIGQGKIENKWQRQGLYRRLLATVLGTLPYGHTLASTERNEMSQPFHEALYANPPAGIAPLEPESITHIDDPQGGNPIPVGNHPHGATREYMRTPTMVPGSGATAGLQYDTSRVKDAQKKINPGWGDLRPQIGESIAVRPAMAAPPRQPWRMPPAKEDSLQTKFDLKTGEAAAWDVDRAQPMTLPWGDKGGIERTTTPDPYSSFDESQKRKLGLHRGKGPIFNILHHGEDAMMRRLTQRPPPPRRRLVDEVGGGPVTPERAIEIARRRRNPNALPPSVVAVRRKLLQE